ncbi:MAG: hypothetical protein MjAS7_2002 [Metallosphaera javensis (ex Sakai et al. 2022)]|nr:MAG: hypothetical protein MjAS7_2002 [Metallosphaera javensis (ex Sakai et al. 2022)]
MSFKPSKDLYKPFQGESTWQFIVKFQTLKGSLQTSITEFVKDISNESFKPSKDLYKLCAFFTVTFIPTLGFKPSKDLYKLKRLST